MTASFSSESLLAHQPFVYAVARGLLNNEAEAEDVVQETWLRALRQDAGAMTAPRSWLARVVRNLVKDRHRGESRRRAREEAVARPEEIVADSASKLEGQRAVVDAVLALEEPYRSVVLLRYYEGLSPAAIAESLDREAATVRSQLHRAHAALRSSMDGAYGGDRQSWAGLFLPAVPVALGGAPQLTATDGAGAGASSTALPLGVKLAALAAIFAVALIGLPPLLERASTSDDVAQANVELPAVSELSTAGAEEDLAPGDVRTPSARTPGGASANSLEIAIEQNGIAVADADVWFVRLSDVDPEVVAEDPLIDTDLARFLRAFGTQHTADENGLVHLAWAGDAAGVFATSPGFEGVVSTEDVEDGRLRIELTKSSEVQAVVRDADGAPVPGIRVALRTGLPDDPSGRWGDNSWMNLLTAESDAQGLVTFRGFAGQMKWSQPGEPYYEVRLLIPGVDTGFTFDPEEERSEPIVLRAPRTCALRVRALDSAGKRIDMDALVTVRGLRQATANELSARLIAGEAHFPKLAPGVAVQVVIESQEEGLVWQERGTTAAAAGGSSTIDVVAPNRPTLVGRALDETGAPLAGETLHVQLLSENRAELQRVKVKTDDAGRYRVELNEKVPAGSVVLASLLTWGVKDMRGGWQTRADYGSPFEVPAGEKDLGELTLRDAQPLIRGRCVDLRGEPVEGLYLSLAEDMDRYSSRVETDAEGRFEVTGLWAERIEISTERGEDRVVVEPRSLVRGTQDTLVRVAHGGTIAGSVKLDASFPAGDMIFVVYTDGVEMKGGTWRSLTVIDAQDGSFESSGMEAGTYHCRIMRNGATLLEVRTVHVLVEETTRPLELQSASLGEAFQWVEFSVATEDGGAVHASARLYDDERIVDYQNSVRGDEAVKLSYQDKGSPRVVITQSGYRPQTFDPRQAPEIVRLKRAIAVQLTSKVRPVLERGDTRAQLSLHLELDADGEPVEGVSESAWVPSALAERGSAQVFFPTPGVYRLHVALHHDDGGGMSSVGESRPLDVTLEVHEYDDGGTLRIKLPRDVLGEQ